MRHLLTVVADLQQMGVGLVSLTAASNPTSAQGRLVFKLFVSPAKFERELLRERTHAGLAAARVRGRLGPSEEEAERPASSAETPCREQVGEN